MVSKRTLAIAFILVVTTGFHGAPVGAQGSEPPVSSGIVGLPREALDHIRGIDDLFARANASAAPRIQPGAAFKLGELVARFRLEESDQDVLRIARQAGADEIVRKSPLGLFLLRGPKSEAATQRMIDLLWERNEVVTVTPNYTTVSLVGTFSPNDPHAVSGAQWYLDQPSDIDLDLPEAWGDITRGSQDVVVAVMDTGIVKDHPEFVGRLWENPGEIPGNQMDDDGNGYPDDINGWDTTSPDGDPDIGDTDGGPSNTGVGHGTYVSSVLMANTDNLHQVAGVDHNARLLTVRSLNQTNDADCDFILAGLDYLIMTSQYYDVLNMSWVEYVNFCFLIGVSLDTLADQDVLMITGTVNFFDDSDRYWPGRHEDTITMGSTDDTDVRANFGYGSSLDFMAPGIDIYTASFDNPQSMNAFHVEDGNSFAAPMVAGIATLALSVKPSLTKDELYDALKESAVDLGAPGRDDFYGWGRINAYDALQAIAAIFEDGFETGDVGEWTSALP
jgi:subtilisin family serine protease